MPFVPTRQVHTPPRVTTPPRRNTNSSKPLTGDIYKLKKGSEDYKQNYYMYLSDSNYVKIFEKGTKLYNIEPNDLIKIVVEYGADTLRTGDRFIDTNKITLFDTITDMNDLKSVTARLHAIVDYHIKVNELHLQFTDNKAPWLCNTLYLHDRFHNMESQCTGIGGAKTRRRRQRRANSRRMR